MCGSSQRTWFTRGAFCTTTLSPLSTPPVISTVSRRRVKAHGARLEYLRFLVHEDDRLAVRCLGHSGTRQAQAGDGLARGAEDDHRRADVEVGARVLDLELQHGVLLLQAAAAPQELQLRGLAVTEARHGVADLVAAALVEHQASTKKLDGSMIWKSWSAWLTTWPETTRRR